MEAWIPWLASWYPIWPLSRKTREVVLAILLGNSLELRIAFLSYQIRKLFPVSS